MSEKSSCGCEHERECLLLEKMGKQMNQDGSCPGFELKGRIIDHCAECPHQDINAENDQWLKS